MKLVIAIIHDDDSQIVINALNTAGFSVTKLCSTGGFLKAGNTTLMIGTEEGKVDMAINLIKKNSRGRKHLMTPPVVSGVLDGMLTSYPYDMVSGCNDISADCSEDNLLTAPHEVDIGKATIFVINIEKFEKI